MELLKQKILQEGVIVSPDVLKLDTLLNHQVDPQFIMELGKEFASRFADSGITKVLTVESSGITVAFATAYVLGVPMIFARRKKTLITDEEVYMERVPSFTKGIVTDILVTKQVFQPNDKILLIDDIIANGDALRGLMAIIEKAGVELAGIGIVIEKSFQAGASSLRERGVRIESLAKIRSLANNKIEFE